MPRNPDWTRDELILALDLYLSSGRRQLGAEHPDVVALSRTLNRLPVHPQVDRGSDFRNPNGVSMTLGTLLAADPTYVRAGLRGNRLVRTVWEDLAGDTERLRETANAIRAMAEAVDASVLPTEAASGIEEEFPEGRLLTRLHHLRERNRSAVRRKKEKVLQQTGLLMCEACSFDFAATFGELGLGFAECHHRTPISRLVATQPTLLSDLAIVCANCHRMIHRSRPLLTVEELRCLVLSVRSVGHDLGARAPGRAEAPKRPAAPGSEVSTVLPAN